jgi:ribosomal protein S18 acetylase RimI-like enzyme
MRSLEQCWVIGDGGFCGYIQTGEADKDVWHNWESYLGTPLVQVDILYVHPLRRGQGWADELMQKAIRYFDSKGIPMCLRAYPYELSRPYRRNRSRSTMRKLAAFYRQYGFERVYTTRQYRDNYFMLRRA